MLPLPLLLLVVMEVGSNGPPSSSTSSASSSSSRGDPRMPIKSPTPLSLPSGTLPHDNSALALLLLSPFLELARLACLAESGPAAAALSAEVQLCGLFPTVPGGCGSSSPVASSSARDHDLNDESESESPIFSSKPSVATTSLLSSSSSSPSSSMSLSTCGCRCCCGIRFARGLLIVVLVSFLRDNCPTDALPSVSSPWNVLLPLVVGRRCRCWRVRGTAADIR
mmetsp:Transcript_3530/g.6208  ORF Transcript_3530/g.6208 Transcript_3530/m.6208 type:complete len:224 (-) Transcript_3530:29-700(-)